MTAITPEQRATWRSEAQAHIDLDADVPEKSRWLLDVLQPGHVNASRVLALLTEHEHLLASHDDLTEERDHWRHRHTDQTHDYRRAVADRDALLEAQEATFDVIERVEDGGGTLAELTERVVDRLVAAEVEVARLRETQRTFGTVMHDQMSRAEAAEDRLAVILAGLASLRSRLRPGIEAAPWVCEEIAALTRGAQG